MRDSDSETNIEVIDWQAFVAVVVNYVSKGYTWYYIFEYPLKKQDKWKEIDKKILNKYPIQISKDQRYRRQKKGLARFAMFRWGNQAVLLHTDGDLDVRIDDQFRHIHTIPVPVKIGEETILEITHNRGTNKTNVKLSRETYRLCKERLNNAVMTRVLKLVETEFNKLRGLGGYSLLNEQRKRLAVYVRKRLKHYKISGKVELRYHVHLKPGRNIYTTPAP